MNFVIRLIFYGLGAISLPDRYEGDYCVRASKSAVEMIKKFERCSLRPYSDGKNGKFSVGWGHQILAEDDIDPENDIISQTEADMFLERDIKRVEEAIMRNVRVELNQNQFDALVSFVYNLGEGALRKSTLLKRLNTGDYDSVPYEMLKWVHFNGKPNRGLKIRRKLEADVWNRPSQEPRF